MTAWTGTWTVLKLALRRDRVMIPAWIATFVFTVFGSAISVEAIYPDGPALRLAGELINATAAMVALYGPIYDVTSLGAVSLVKLIGIGTAMVGLLAGMLVVRHTRADEEVGRHELTASGVLGRYATVTAALIVGALTGAAVGLLSGLSLAAAGLPFAGSMAFGSAWAGAGVAFAAVAALTSQIASTARSARGLTAIVLIASYVIRAVADTSAHDRLQWLTWVSPIGWAQQVRPFAGDRWWSLLPLLGFTVLISAIALFTLTRRDLGSGLLPDRDGSPEASRRLVSPLGLAWRLSRGGLLAWAIAYVVVGALIGSIAPNIEGMLDNENVRRFFEMLGGVNKMSDLFISAELGFAGVITAVYGISTILRLHGEELTGRAEPVLVGGVGRMPWLIAQLLLAFAGTAVLLTIEGVALAAAYSFAVDGTGHFWAIVGGAVSRIPATWVMTSLALLIYAVRARSSYLAWVALVMTVVVWEFGPLMDLPDWTREIAPFAHGPALPGNAFEWAPFLWLVAVAAGLSAVAVATFQRRDISPD
jgi:ABC-2 type transport system permease protein